MDNRKYSCSAQLNNELEQDHYDCARDYFRDYGTSTPVIGTCKNFFKDYDSLKQDVAEDLRKTGKVSEAYISDTLNFNAKRAIEIIDIALQDHNQQIHEPTKSNKWRRA